MNTKRMLTSFLLVLLIAVGSFSSALAGGQIITNGITLSYPNYPVTGPALASCEPWNDPTANTVSLSGLQATDKVEIFLFAYSEPFSGPFVQINVPAPAIVDGSVTVAVPYPMPASLWPGYDSTTGVYSIAMVVTAVITRDGVASYISSPKWWVECNPQPLPAKLGNFVWEDKNADGVQGFDEPGVPGVEVKLFTCAGEFVDSTFTDANGFYLFDGLPAGDYYVEFVAPDGFVFTGANFGDDALDSDADPFTGKTECTTLVAGEYDDTLDAGLFKPAALGDFVWNDDNMNGVQDEGETGVSGVLVELFTCAGESMGSAFTDADGFYLFSSLKPGDYYVKFTSPDGYFFSTANFGDDAFDSDADPFTGMTSCVNLSSGETDLTVDAGIYQKKASLGDFVWYDMDNDGIQDEGELGIEGVQVELFACLATVPSDTTFTNAMGYYNFGNLMPGSYYVKFTAPTGYMFTMQNQGSDDAFDSDANPLTGVAECTTLVAGENDLSWDAGLYKPTAPGTGTPGYWKNHPEAWPVDSIVIGGRAYTKDEALFWLWQDDKHDKTITMFRSLVAAKLNILIGNDASCIVDTVLAADAWMATYPVGSMLRANTEAWKIGEPLYLMLDAYNNGLLWCAVHRD